MQKAKGFSLIELLVAISIIGILAASALMALNRYRQKAHDTILESDFRRIREYFEGGQLNPERFTRLRVRMREGPLTLPRPHNHINISRGIVIRRLDWNRTTNRRGVRELRFARMCHKNGSYGLIFQYNATPRRAPRQRLRKFTPAQQGRC